MGGKIMTREMLTVEEIKDQFPISPDIERFIKESRQIVESILRDNDKRRLVISGPCSVHDFDEAFKYARKLSKLQEQVQETMFLVMRVYFEKPRTDVGWKGLINDPGLDGSYDVIRGLKIARKLLLTINKLGVPVTTEFLQPLVSNFISDLISHGSVGARTSESQPHREMVSNLLMPIGFKNSTSGDLNAAVNGVKAADNSHVFLGCDENGISCIIESEGNPCPHVILRGGKKPNYDSISVSKVLEKMALKGLNPAVVVDCSHANSGKDYKRQSIVWRDVFNQIEFGGNIVGVMLESNLNAGNQKITSCLKRGVSVTDACISWEETEELILSGHSQLSKLSEQQAQAA